LKNSKVLKTILFVLSLGLIVLGTWRLTNPVSFYATNSGVKLSNDVNLLSEIRAAGGAVVGIGILIMLGVFIDKLTYTSTLVSIVIFFSFGIARILAIAMDGNPGEKIFQGIFFEFVSGLAAVFAFYKYREK